MKYIILPILFIILLSSCKQEKQQFGNSKISFLRNTKKLAEGVWLEEKFAEIIKTEGLIGNAIKNTKNPLAILIDYKNYRNDSLFISLLTSKGKKMQFPFVIRQSGQQYVYEFPNLGFDSRNFVSFSVSPKDTVLQIKKYNEENQLVDIKNYRKISELKAGSSVDKETSYFLNKHLFEGNYAWGLASDYLYYQCKANTNSEILNFDGFEKFFFLLNKSASNQIKLKIGKEYSTYEYTKTDGIIRLSKLKPESAGRLTYYLKPLFLMQAHSNYFVDDIAVLNINEDKEHLNIKLSISVPPTYSGKTDSLYRKIINAGFFNYKIFKGDKVISVPKQLTKANLGKLYTQSAYMFFSELGMKQPTHSYQAEIDLPKYAFKNLGEGEHKLTLYVYQRPYSQAFEERKKSNLHHVYIDKKKKWLWAKLDFTVNVPKIYSTKLQLKEIKINRFTNLDFSLNSNGSQADIYWTIYYPQNKLYWKSKVSKNAKIYKNTDVVELYSYTEYPLFNIIVFDEDRGSNSELIGKTSLSTIEIPTEYKTFKFGKVDEFVVKVER